MLDANRPSRQRECASAAPRRSSAVQFTFPLSTPSNVASPAIASGISFFTR